MNHLKTSLLSPALKHQKQLGHIYVQDANSNEVKSAVERVLTAGVSRLGFMEISVKVSVGAAIRTKLLNFQAGNPAQRQ